MTAAGQTPFSFVSERSALVVVGVLSVLGLLISSGAVAD
jgi:hypothetical protein